MYVHILSELKLYSQLAIGLRNRPLFQKNMINKTKSHKINFQFSMQMKYIGPGCAMT